MAYFNLKHFQQHHSIDSLQTVSILLPPDFPSSILISFPLFPGWQFRLFHIFCQIPGPLFFVLWPNSCLVSPQIQTWELIESSLLSLHLLFVFFCLFLFPQPFDWRIEEKAWRAEISILGKKIENTNWQAWILRVALWILDAALSKRPVQPCETSH